MKKSSLLLLAVLSFSANTYAASNMLMPIIKCTVTKEEIKKAKEANSDISEGFTIMADFENLMTRTSGPAVIIHSDKHVGAVSESERESSEIGSASTGTFHGKALNEDGNLSGVVFVGDLVTYNDTYKSVDTVTVSLDKKTNAMKAEVKSDPRGTSTYVSSIKYNCKGALPN